MMDRDRCSACGHRLTGTPLTIVITKPREKRERKFTTIPTVKQSNPAREDSDEDANDSTTRIGDGR